METKKINLNFQVFYLHMLLEDSFFPYKEKVLSCDDKKNIVGDEVNVLEKENLDVKKSPIILVAEDTDSNFTLVSILLRKEYQIVRAKNGVEAVKLHAEVHPDLVLMDIQMPELNGLDATRLIREVDQKVPIIALTAYAFESDRLAFMETGGSDYMSKPINPDELRKLVKRRL